MEKILSWKSHGKWAKIYKVMEIEKSLKKLWNFSTAYHESRTRRSDNSISIDVAVIWLWEAFGLCSRFQFVMIGRRQTIFFTPYFPFEKRFPFHVQLYVINTHNDLLYLPS